MTTIPPTEEFPRFYDVLDWETALVQRYCSHDPESSASKRSRMRGLQIVTIRRFKEKTNAEHEYVVAKIYDPDLCCNRYVQIDRYAGDELLKPRIDSIRHSIPTTSQSSPVSKEYNARDCVKSIAAWPTGDICIDNVTCQDSQMILLDLAIAAKVVHEHSTEYRALKYQCYWYSATIVSILRRSFLEAKVSNNASSLIADNGQEMEFSPTLGGTYKSFPIYTEENNKITEIHKIFKTYRVEVYSSVNLLNTGYSIFADDPFITLDYRSRAVCCTGG